ncbi:MULTISPECIES: YfgM family protein [Chitinibacter]|uniref:YfgM family protein n=1 Tax=Chitinibacter TaxID=230666 RepID=UPI0004250D0F|nr:MULTISPECIES: tetratricopeptide repeat protein [Chitinibacter]
MAAFDLQEQEQIAELKAWWHSWGKALAAAVVLALLAYAGWSGWQTWQKHRAAEAAELYAQLQLQAMDEAKFTATLTTLKTDFGSTPYAARAALAAAKLAYMKGQPAKTRDELNWVISNAKEVTLRDSAKLRLAGVLLDDKKYDEALALVKAPEEESYSGLFAEVRGDVLLAKQDKSGAADAYRQALAKLPKDAPNVKLLEVKLDTLGAN